MNTTEPFEVSDIVPCQETGKASMAQVLKALGVPRDRWKHTVLQVTAFVIPIPKEDESCEEPHTSELP